MVINYDIDLSHSTQPDFSLNTQLLSQQSDLRSLKVISSGHG